MNKLKKEYYEFGPWLTEITGEEDITHQFNHLTNQILASDLAVKIPMDKEWRQIKEGDLLYNEIIAVSENDISYHRIIDDMAYSCKLYFREIRSISICQDMLSCKINIDAVDEHLHIQYVPLPIELSNRLIELLQERHGSSKNMVEIHETL